MKKQTQQLVAKLDRLLDNFGLHDPHFFIFMQIGFSLLDDLLMEVREAKRAFRSRESLIASLENHEFQRSDFCTLLRFADQLPAYVRWWAGKLDKIIRDSTPAPRSGRPPALTPRQSREVIAYMKQLSGNSYSKGECVKKTAKKFKVSPRTIQRAWREQKVPRLSNEKIDEIMKGIFSRRIQAITERLAKVPTSRQGQRSQGLM